MASSPASGSSLRVEPARDAFSPSPSAYPQPHIHSPSGSQKDILKIKKKKQNPQWYTYSERVRIWKAEKKSGFKCFFFFFLFFLLGN